MSAVELGANRGAVFLEQLGALGWVFLGVQCGEDVHSGGRGSGLRGFSADGGKLLNSNLCGLGFHSSGKILVGFLSVGQLHGERVAFSGQRRIRGSQRIARGGECGDVRQRGSGGLQRGIFRAKVGKLLECCHKFCFSLH